jgi:cobaltochelatase CobS
MLARDGSTYFEPGPLALAMKHGWVYCADEYDFAMPAVLAVYQPVLEGEPLYIKEAPPEWRHIVPHPNFRFVATGNTNGSGDETGLYQGTQLGNAANYSRFAVTEEVGYMAPKIEAAVVAQQSGAAISDAERVVDFANEVREAFKASRISATISPRELIAAAKVGLVKGSDWRTGLKLAFTNRLPRVDKETVEQFAQRVFG